ncbi:aminoglycoside phosphotransferase family protein [Bryobacter aggregatus]|uniref:aminoglycoside phosphotransferase family protein n=1 Tax=Bryobacter aggregatus TaxID=360054 RepID=UPI0004E0DE64|nr:aminoglycoside phosphotransferase family protein [Bryobacter aggregatus]
MSQFEPYLQRWELVPDGLPIHTSSSSLLPVIYRELPAMLKLAVVEEEKRAGILMDWWGGDGAALVLEQHQGVLLLERAMGESSLSTMAREGRDDEASRIACLVAAKLHTPRAQPPAHLVPLEIWFQDLGPAALQHGGVLQYSAAAARELLASPQDIVGLHGDLHHGNILDFGPRGWLAIDPKGLIGERTFDFANLFCNPDPETALLPGRLVRQLEIVTTSAGLDRKRLLQWILAWSGLSAVWMMQDGLKPDLEISIAELAVSELARESSSL